MATKSTKKATKTASKKVTVKVATKKPEKAPKTAKKLAESKPARKPVRRLAKPAEPVPVKLLAVENGESNVAVSTTTIEKPTFDSLTDTSHSITPEMAEKIAESRVTHEDERPPNSEPKLETIAEQAWHNVKGEGDPELKNCVFTHQEKYQFHSDAILKGSSPMSGETLLARFEQECARLNKGE